MTNPENPTPRADQAERDAFAEKARAAQTEIIEWLSANTDYLDAYRQQINTLADDDRAFDFETYLMAERTIRWREAGFSASNIEWKQNWATDVCDAYGVEGSSLLRQADDVFTPIDKMASSSLTEEDFPNLDDQE